MNISKDVSWSQAEKVKETMWKKRLTKLRLKAPSSRAKAYERVSLISLKKLYKNLEEKKAVQAKAARKSCEGEHREIRKDTIGFDRENERSPIGVRQRAEKERGRIQEEMQG